MFEVESPQTWGSFPGWCCWGIRREMAASSGTAGGPSLINGTEDLYLGIIIFLWPGMCWQQPIAAPWTLCGRGSGVLWTRPSSLGRRSATTGMRTPRPSARLIGRAKHLDLATKAPSQTRTANRRRGGRLLVLHPTRWNCLHIMVFKDNVCLCCRISRWLALSPTRSTPGRRAGWPSMTSCCSSWWDPWCTMYLPSQCVFRTRVYHEPY